ncbi:MAG: DUF1844 domain-containing protein [Armatimonas sp.]
MPEDPEEEGFTFVDRRRNHQEESAPKPTPAPQEVVEAPTFLAQDAEQELDSEAFDPSQLPPGDYTLPDVREMLIEYMMVLRDVSVLRLGLAPNPATGKSERDLTQAKIAIDTIAFLATQIEAVLPPDERLPLKAMISDLQLNYVRQTGGGAA